MRRAVRAALAITLMGIGSLPGVGFARAAPPPGEPVLIAAESPPAAVTAQAGLAVTASGYGLGGLAGRQLGYSFIVENTHPTLAAQRAQYQAAAYDPAGAVLKTDSGYMELVLPGQRLGVSNTMFLEEGQSAARVEVQVSAPRMVDPQDQQPLGVDNVSIIEERFALRATGLIRSPYGVDLKSIYVSAVPYDAQGNIIGGGVTFVQFVPANGQAAASVNIASSQKPARVELYPMITILSR